MYLKWHMALDKNRIYSFERSVFHLNGFSFEF